SAFRFPPPARTMATIYNHALTDEQTNEVLTVVCAKLPWTGRWAGFRRPASTPSALLRVDTSRQSRFLNRFTGRQHRQEKKDSWAVFSGKHGCSNQWYLHCKGHKI